MPIEQHDIAAHRSTPFGLYSKADFARRILWAALVPLFCLSPRHLYGWRNFLLRAFGAKVGRGVRVYPSVRIFAPWKLTIGDEVTIAWDVRIYNLAAISIGDRCLVSQGAHLCAGNHDYRQPHLPFTNKPIVVESDCWVCADAFVGSGVTVGRLAVVGARAVVTKNVPERAVMAGNPARQVSER
jgi:putative colanic acid biosynthesis acetyltransferase WcaF